MIWTDTEVERRIKNSYLDGYADGKGNRNASDAEYIVDPDSVVQWIKNEAASQKISHRKLADLSDINYGTINGWFYNPAGNKPHIYSVCAVCEALGCEVVIRRKSKNE